ncbi:universal stress protein [Enemella evansiae]|uniref:universal stress protein n=1 Tax=Enemella evansiae TaxID=2016499 RepID=UPI000B96E721|nr:universal stress protein [Enemella evansiae]PFG66203.1 nucleotide-binding universal stress UspA family protein [Propionibacteriaceae bacterium ES.041]OYN95007.1 hypothetical protein CGZ96_16250 [Enemella evansiae]OYO04803.1 hypothetical protein CGZ95_02705 [Enemella evansiae]OYO06444.1 hypothetical protein CGZ97_07430 [Enemella evansiae]OYO08954.1 hypothetical protein CGZ98_14305 [Enemella evansiae]
MSVVAVAYNSSDAGRAALRSGIAEAKRDGRGLVVLHVVEDLSADARDHAERETRAAVDAAGGDPDQVQVVVGAQGMDPAGALIDQAVQAGAELLVIGGRHRSAVGKLLMGSTVQRILLDAPMPLLFVKPDNR